MNGQQISNNKWLRMVYCFLFFCPRISGRKILFIPIFQRWPVNTLKRISQSFQRVHFSWNLGSELLFSNEGIPSHTSFCNLWWRIIRWINRYHRHTVWQSKPSALEKVETLEKLERIGIPRLLTEASVMDRCHCRRETQMIKIVLKDFI